MKKHIFLTIFFIASLLLTGSRLLAQDTISTAGVEFKAIDSSPVKKQTTVRENSVKSQLTTLTKPAASQTLWTIFVAGFIGGLAAFFMPCIFPMLPLTVSFFSKSSDKKNSGVGKALIYGLSIIIIYVVLGLLVTIVFGASALNNLATNGIFNLAFFILLVVFAASFLGAFEITLPSGWVNAMDAKSDRSGLFGLFFMAATLALVSFSCTGPIVGTLLVQAATTGALLGPAVGMLGYSFALAIPFALFAMFPGLMNALPKSGGWLNSVKAVLGFLELALSLKFLSNVDLAYHWHFFDREIFLVLWIVIFALLGFYLLGKLTLAHDTPVKSIAVPRLFLAIIVLSFAAYMIPGLWGAPLKSISAFLPPMSTQDFDLSATVSNGNTASLSDPKKRKYSDLFDAPKGFHPYFDYEEGLAYAKIAHKPVMIDFTGHACVNCRKMEANVWTDKAVSNKINQDYILIQLYVDDKTNLAESEHSVEGNGTSIKTIGNKWSQLQIEKFRSNSQPFYVLLDPETQQPLVTPKGADFDPASYLKYLNSGLSAYH